MQLAEMVKKYVMIRDHKRQATEEFDKSLKPVNEALEKLENMMLSALNDEGADSVKSEYGTVYRTTHHNASIKDRDAFMQFVRDHAQWEALDVRANKTFVREFMDKSGPIPGVEFSSISKVGVRRA